MFRPKSAFAYHNVDRAPIPKDTPLGRLLAQPTTLAVERTYSLTGHGQTVPRVDAALWETTPNGVARVPFLGPDISPPNAGHTAPERAHAIFQAMAENMSALVLDAHKSFQGPPLRPAQRMRVFLMAEGWVLADDDADLNTPGFSEWEAAFTEDITDADGHQRMTDQMDWPRFCIPALPRPTSAHDALAQQGAAERLIVRTLNIHKAAGFDTLEHLDWTATPAR